MSEKSKRCACGFEVAEFAFGLAAIGSKVDELRVHESYKLSPELIRLHRQLTDHVIDQLRKVRDSCSIDIEKEEERLRRIQAYISKINDPKIQIILSDDITFVTDGIRRKLYECAREK